MQRFGKVLLRACIGLLLFLVVRLEDVVLLLGEPRFYIAGYSICQGGRVEAGHRRVHSRRIVLVLMLILCMLYMLRVLGRLRLRQIEVAPGIHLGRVVGPVRVVGRSDECHDLAA